jgi:class 3 adenylate cyclase/predicted ATPase
VKCSQCQEETPPQSNFCLRCGAPIAAPEADLGPRFTSPESYTPEHLAQKILTSRHALEGERKHVTVLFADLKGSMELLAGRDPEEARSFLDPVLEHLMEAVHRYEGTVNQVMGDGIMALFGAPLAHEDHAVRACHAALRMQESVNRHAAAVQRSHGLGPQIRVGLHSGEVVVRTIGNDLRMDYTAVGQTTHIAARMEQMATPGSILITAATLRLAAGAVQVRPLGPVPIKGLSEPIDVYELRSPATTPSRLRFGDGSPFVGRQRELEALVRALDQTGKGRGQVVGAVGEPGVGKTRLFHELVHSGQIAGWLVLDTTGVSYGTATPYLPMVDLLKAYFEIDAGDDVRTIRARVADKLTANPDLQATGAAFLALFDASTDEWQALSPPQRRQQTLDAIKRLLVCESRIRPVCLIVENLHWIDSETQAVLDTLVENLETSRILLLVNYRPGYRHGWASQANYLELGLDPLPPESADLLLDAILGDEAGLQPLKQFLIERTEGNPFFIEESVHALVEIGMLAGKPGAFRLAKAMSVVRVPATVQAVLAARIDRLPPDDKQLLQIAAVLGRNVRLALLAAVAGESEDTLRRRLVHLTSAEFMYETKVPPAPEYTFRHALTQDVAYESLLQPTRQKYHRRIARALVEHFPEDAETRPELVAHHYTQAGLNDDAIVHWHRAGVRASQQAAYVAAATHFRNGLELLATLPETRERMQRELDLQTSLGPVLMATKGYTAPELAAAHGRARALCQALGETLPLYPILWGLWAFYLVRAELETARELSEQLLRVAYHGHGADYLVEAHYAVGDTLFWLGDFTTARTHFETSIAAYDPREHATLARRYGENPKVTSLSYLSWTLWSIGCPDQALTASRDAVALAEAVAHPPSLAFALFFAARLHLMLGNISAVRAWTDALLALATKESFAFWVALGRVWQGWLLTQDGRHDEGIGVMRESIGSYRAVGANLADAICPPLLVEALGKAGRIGDALGVLDERLADAHDDEDRYFTSELYRLKGQLLLEEGTHHRAETESCFRRALESARAAGATSLALRAAIGLARLWADERRADARRLLSEIYGSFREGFETTDLREARQLLARLETN